MPIPTDPDTKWPPDEHAPAYAAYRDWDAWYSGHVDKLIRAYTNRRDYRPEIKVRPTQLMGGIVGQVSRWLWGNPPRLDQRDGRLHIPVPADLARTAADLLFSEPPTLSVPGTDGPREEGPQVERLAQLAEQLPTLLLEAAEASAALGGVYLRPVVDRDIDKQYAFPVVVHADAALPAFTFGQLREVTFHSELVNDGRRVLRLLEHHEPGSIEYALHEGTPEVLGRRVPLDEHPDAKRLAEGVDQDSRQSTGLDRLDVVYIPNIGPQRLWRSMPNLRYLGRSDFDGIEPLFDRFDEVWTSWMRDIHLARGRVFVPEVYLTNLGPGQGSYWDHEREVYSQLSMLPKPGGESSMITPNQFEIRVEEHHDTCEALLRAILRHAGYNAETFGEEGDAAITATEVRARQRRSYATRDRKLALCKPRLGDYLELHFEFEKAQQMPGAVEPFRPEIEFGDGVSEDPKALAEVVGLLHGAQAISRRTAIAMVHPHWTRKQIDEEMAAIQEEQAVEMEAEAGFQRPPAGGE